ncbi:carboxymuconolactone decarboxylase family protein [Streptomyces sp. ME19-01-6]|uniref:carboxymuconolactone decarboxylase family protein n=1 Tax=Streptomyces sp. ME19-01-6 TaxID=3028686 RepID=UPI0029AFF669|nr:carboxymuconolactone decarboxylase family protein [Streptomyces sp. ME19-01-6]MDX3227480.1 carboxymuconolactone decarboxylase family protein [Streptomyces sp. ME19-01-6]
MRTINETPQSTHEHGPRMRLAKLAPEFYKAMVGLDAAARKSLDPTLVDLIKVRASQINHCAFCVHMHTRDAREAGETEERLYLLSAWEEATGLFTEKERAALALTEAVTVLTDGFVPDEVYERAAAHFEEAELAQVIAAIIAINAWNRIGVTTRTVPGKA